MFVRRRVENDCRAMAREGLPYRNLRIFTVWHQLTDLGLPALDLALMESAFEGCPMIGGTAHRVFMAEQTIKDEEAAASMFALASLYRGVYKYSPESRASCSWPLWR